MIKVLHVLSDSNIGGAGILVLNLLENADTSEFESVLALPENSLLIPRAEALGVRVVPMNGKADRSFSPVDIPALVRLLRHETPDILHTHASLTARLAGTLVRTGVTVDTKHCCFAPGRLQRSPIFRALSHTLDQIGNVSYIATANAARDILLDFGTPAERITVIPGGSAPVAEISENEKKALRSSLGIPTDSFVIGYAARMEKGKGHEDFLRAAQLCLRRPDMVFLAVGSGSMEPDLHNASRGISNLIFTGFRKDIGKVMNVFDVNVNCSYLSETSSLSLSEGMSLGKPLVVTDCGGNADMAKGCGIVVPMRNPEAIADAVLKLADSPSLYASLSAGAAQRFRENYTAAGMARRTEALYRNLLKQEREMRKRAAF